MRWVQNISKEIFDRKYKLHNEKDEEEVFRLIAKEISSNEKHSQKEVIEEEFYKMMSNGYFIPAGRILANARPDSPLKNYNNCFVLDIEDSMNSITSSVRNYMTILKQGGGVGFNISKLRPEGTPLSTGGYSSGPLSFLEIFDQASKTIEVGGQRRGASICIMDVDHPDIEKFITYKRGDENKKLTQFNISVGITDKFIKALKNNKNWDLKWNDKIYKTVKAKDLYNLLIKNAYLFNDPGILNLDTVNKYNNGYYLYEMKSTNPCITGDTLIAVADGRNAVSIKQLTEENVDVPVYCKNEKGITEIRMMRNFRVTGYNKKLLRIHLDDDSHIDCTPNHKFLLKNGNYLEATNLEIGSSLKTETKYECIFKDHCNEDETIHYKVIKIEEIDKDTVYNGTVDEFHNYGIMLPVENFTKSGYPKYNVIFSHNCGEIPLPPGGVCCLGAINLTKFVVKQFDEDCSFDWDLFFKTVKTGVRFLDNVLDVTEYPLSQIEERALSERRIGLGITGLGDMFAMLGIEYGSEESKGLADLLFSNLRDYSYDASIELAKEKGSFPAFKKDIMKSNFIKNLPTRLQEDIKKHGLRNVSVNTIAPTGTTSFSVGQNCSSGIEPIFALEYDRHIRTDNSETKKEKVYDYAWLKYLEFMSVNNYENVDVPNFFKTALEIDPYDHIEIQSIAQKYIDSSISKTINIPENYSKDDYSKLFLTAYEKELKGITSFRIGSMKGVLEVGEDQDNRPKYIERTDAPKRPEVLPCDIHEISVNKERHIVLIGKLQGTLYEIFVTNDPDNQIEKIGKKEGIIRKKSKGQYQLLIENGKEKVIFDNISEKFDNVYASLSRFISMGLRHGVNLQFIVNQLQKDKNFLGFERAVSRVLKKYIKDGEKVLSSEKCENCGEDLIYREGCISCVSCGWSKCG